MKDAVREKPSRRRVLALLTALAAFNTLDQQILGILLEPIRQEFGIGDIALGALSGPVFAVFHTILSIPAGLWSVNHSRRKLIMAGAVVWGAMTMLCGLAQTYVQLALARLGVGVGEAAGLPPSQAWVSDLYQTGERATALAVLSAGANVGILLAYLIGGFFGQALGWRQAFFVAGAPPIFLAAMLLFAVRESERPTADAPAHAVTPGIVVGLIGQIWRDRALRHVMIAAVLAMTVGYGAIAWVPSFLIRTHGFSLPQVGAYLAVVIGIGGAIGSWLGGRASDAARAFDVRWSLWIVAIAFVAARPLAMGFYGISDPTLAMLLFVVPAMVGMIHMGPSIAVLHDRVAPALRPVASALFMTVITLVGLGVGPLAVGYLSQVIFAEHGADSLRWALFSWQCVGFWAAVHFYLAGRYLARAA
ncbi:MAG: spinster family MFS transporter [Beijerinckiaceae bacterium]